MEITKALCLSTAHVSPETIGLLEGGASSLPMTVWESQYGFFLPTLLADLDMFRPAIPDDLHVLMTLAEANGCEFLRLDADGPVVEDLKVYHYE